MKYAIKFIVFILLFFPAIVTAQESPLRIGLILPLTGPGATWGQHLLNGAQLALSKSGNSNLSIHVEDDRLDAAAAVTAYKKLRSAQNIDAVMVFGSQSAKSVVPLAERDGVISLVITTDPKPVANTKYAFRLCLDAMPQAKALAERLQQEKITRVALIGTTHEAMLEYLDAFDQIAENYGIAIVFRQDYPKSETDFKTQINQITQKEPQAIVTSLLPPSLSSFSRQLRQNQSSLPLYSFAQAENLPEIKASHGTLEDLIFAAVVLSKDFIEQYQARFQEYPQSYAGYSFDLITFAAQANQAGKRTPEELADFIKRPRIVNGACGGYEIAEGSAAKLSTQLMRVNGDQFKAVNLPCTKAPGKNCSD